MNTHSQKLTKLQQEIFSLLCKNVGNPLNQRAIATQLNASAAAITKALPPLEKKGIINIQKKSPMNLNLIQLSQQQEILQWKRAENLRLLYESNVVCALEENYPGCTIIIFGSFSRGDDTHTSDVDIAIIGSKEKQLDLRKFEKILQKPININYYNNWKNIHHDLKENLCNGIVLVGGIEL
jgi:predicted nucleotidyltransferase